MFFFILNRLVISFVFINPFSFEEYISFLFSAFRSSLPKFFLFVFSFPLVAWLFVCFIYLFFLSQILLLFFSFILSLYLLTLSQVCLSSFSFLTPFPFFHFFFFFAIPFFFSHLGISLFSFFYKVFSSFLSPFCLLLLFLSMLLLVSQVYLSVSFLSTFPCFSSHSYRILSVISTFLIRVCLFYKPLLFFCTLRLFFIHFFLLHLIPLFPSLLSLFSFIPSFFL